MFKELLYINRINGFKNNLPTSCDQLLFTRERLQRLFSVGRRGGMINIISILKSLDTLIIIIIQWNTILYYQLGENFLFFFLF